jgi:hypothetical protein
MIAVMTALPLSYFWINAGNFQESLGIQRRSAFLAMVELKLTSNLYVHVGGRPDLVLTVTEQDTMSLDSYMISHGWVRWDQMGARHSFTKGKKSLVVSSAALTRFFRLYKIHGWPQR